MRVLSAVRRETIAWSEAALRVAPGAIGIKMRAFLYPRKFARSPARLYIEPGVVINGWQNIILGDDLVFDRDCCLEARTGALTIGARSGFNRGVWIGADGGRIVLGTDVMVGPYVVFRAANHRFDLSHGSFREQGHEPGQIIVGNNVWIGAHVTLVAGAHIGDSCVVGAGAVVRDLIPEGCVAAGVPAKVIRKLSSDPPSA